MRLPINLIRTDGGTQARAKIHHPTVIEYAQAMQSGHHFPPLIIFFDSSSYWLVDGFHRLEASRLLNYQEVEVDLKLGDLRQAILYAVGANATHGLRRTRADKEHAVKLLLEDAEWGSWSDRSIGRATVTSHSFVAKIRGSLTGFIASERIYTTKHGTEAVMDTSNIGKSQNQAIKDDFALIEVSTPVLERLKSYQQRWKTETLSETLAKLVDSNETAKQISHSAEVSSPRKNNLSLDKKTGNWRRWLGVDPGLAIIGWGVVEGDIDNVDLPVLLDYGTIETTKKRPTSERLWELEVDLRELLQEFQPTDIALEIPLIGQNPNTTRTVLAAVGVIELVCYRERNILPVHLYPSMWKAHLGYGRADNDEVRETISALFNLGEMGRARLDGVGIAYAGFWGVKID